MPIQNPYQTPPQDPSTNPEAPVVGAEDADGFLSLEELDESYRDHLKGLSIEKIDKETIKKIIESSMAQKKSVSNKSRELVEKDKEIENLRQILEGQSQIEDDTDEIDTPPSDPVKPSGSPSQHIAVTENDLFDIFKDYSRDFPELAATADTSEIVNELKAFGYLTADGFNKARIFDHLSARNKQARELKELREFKEQYSKPTVETYDGNLSVNYTGDMTGEVARKIVLDSYGSANPHPRLTEAQEFLNNELRK
jgi:hypothetical protein